MRYVRYDNEKSVADIVNRLLPARKGGSVGAQRAAEVALANLNPHLADLRALKKGAAIILPDTATFRDAPAESITAPAVEMIVRFRAALSEAQRHVEATATAQIERVSDNVGRLKSREVKKAAGESEAAAATIARVSEALATRVARAKALKRASRKMIGTLQKNLDEMARRIE